MARIVTASASTVTTSADSVVLSPHYISTVVFMPSNKIEINKFYELFNNLFTQPKFEERSSVKMLYNPLACWCAHEFKLGIVSR